MVDVIKQFFDSLLGVSLPDAVYQIIAFAIVTNLLIKFFGIFGLESRLLTFTCRIAVVMLALINLTSFGLSLNFGG